MAFDPRHLGSEILDFLVERHLASLTLIRPDGSPHVTPVGFTWDDESQLVRVITRRTSYKSRLLASVADGPAAVCQVDGARWLTLEGRAVVTADPDRCAEGVRRYGERYRPAKDLGAERRVIEISVERVLGRA